MKHLEKQGFEDFVLNPDHSPARNRDNMESARETLVRELGVEAANYLLSTRSLFNDLSDPQLARLIKRIAEQFGD